MNIKSFASYEIIIPRFVEVRLFSQIVYFQISQQK